MTHCSSLTVLHHLILLVTILQTHWSSSVAFLGFPSLESTILIPIYGRLLTVSGSLPLNAFLILCSLKFTHFLIFVCVCACIIYNACIYKINGK